jgi:NTE family protein
MKKIILYLLAITLSGCGTLSLPLRPLPPLPKPVPIKQPVKVALVLGAGGSKGIAHIAVLEVLEQAGVKLDLIVSSSAGSFIGAFYADFKNTKQLMKLFLHIRRDDLVHISYIPSRFGFIQGLRLESFLRQHLRARYFRQLKIPLRIIATDLYFGKLVVLGGGPLIPAIHASSAIPGLFTPVRYMGRMLVDGAVINPLPVTVAKRYKPQLVIAVDISSPLAQKLPNHLFGVVRRSWDISYLYLTRYEARQADVLIKPELALLDALETPNFTTMYLAGRQAALKALPKICQSAATHCRAGWKRLK